MSETALVTRLDESQIAAESKRSLEISFKPLLDRARELVEQSMGITVSDATQVTEIKQAKAARLNLKAHRVNAEHVRKTLKADSLSRGKMIDGLARDIMAIIEPEEKRLEDAERFAERAEAARIESLRKSRLELLAPFMADASMIQLGTMSEPAFNDLLTGQKLAHEAKIAAERQAEIDRVAREKADAEDRERMRVENERLREEAVHREARAKAARDKADALLKTEREAREKLERQAKEAQAAKDWMERETRAAARKAANAPDAEKLRTLAKTLRDMTLPDVDSKAANSVMESVQFALDRLAREIETSASSL